MAASYVMRVKVRSNNTVLCVYNISTGTTRFGEKLEVPVVSDERFRNKFAKKKKKM